MLGSMKRKDRPYLALAVVCLLLGFVGRWLVTKDVSTYDGVLASQMTELAQLENTLEVKKVNRVDEGNKVLSMVTGLDASRQVEDDKEFSKFISKVTTWTGYDGYSAMRDEISRMPLTKNAQTFNSVFLTVMTPAADYGTGSEVSCSFQSMESKVVSIVGDKYAYFTKVNVLASSGGGAKSSMFVCTYMMDMDHEISDLHAYILE